MKSRTLVILCLAIVAGALYGRFQYLRDKGFIAAETSFVDYLTGGSEKPAPKSQAPPAPAPPAQTPEKPKPPPKEAQAPAPPAPGGKKPVAPSPAAPTASALSRARKAIENGKYDQAIELLAAAATTEARELKRDARTLRELVKDVEPDPAAHGGAVKKVTLANGGSFYVVAAEKVADMWQFTLDKGGKSEVEVAQVASVKDADPATFRAERRTELAGYLKQLRGEGVLRSMKAIRVAWRRGFTDVAYKELQTVTADAHQFEALAAVISIEEPREVALVTPEKGENAPESKSAPPEPVSPAPTAPEPVTVPVAPVATKLPEKGPGPSAGTFAAVDAQIEEARRLIRVAINTEGPKAEEAVRSAAKLLASCKENMARDPSLPRGHEYDARITKITLLLDDVIKRSGFGL